MCLPTLLTVSDGLAFHGWTSARPHHHHGYRSTSAPRCTRCFTSRPSAEHAESLSDGRSGRSAQDAFRLEGVAQGGSDTNQQPVEEQDGERHQEAARKRRSLHHAGAADRPGDRRHRVLAVGQLLVPRTRRAGRHGSLTKAKTSPQPTGAHQRGQRVVVVAVEGVESGQRLALGVRYGLAEPLTSRNV